MKSAAEVVVQTSLLQMPHLISDRALVDAVGELADHALARFSAGYSPSIETIAMPKKGLGPRPIGMLSPETKTLYHAIVEMLSPRLPPPSRDHEWSEHERFGTGDSNQGARLVDFDIAGCYEYIDHRILAEELVIQTVDAPAVEALSSLLLELFPRGVGLPQAMDPSHRMADVYLEHLERGIVRSGYDVRRYADDFRVVAPSLRGAHEAIERAVEMARKLGLVLADGKTRMRSPTSVLEELEERELTFQRYRDKAADALTSIQYVSDHYEDLREVEVLPADAEVDFAALTDVVDDWVNGDKSDRRMHAHFGARALRVLQIAPTRLDDDWLVTIAQREPIRLMSVVNYLGARKEMDRNWAVLARLTRLERQGPWARLWMVRTGDIFSSMNSADEAEVIAWAEAMLFDRYEVVRAEAAWFLAGRKGMLAHTLGRLYVDASDVSRIGIAASAGRLDGRKRSKLGDGIRGDSALTRAAYDWASG